MTKLKNFFSHALTLILLLVLGVILVLFLSNRVMQPTSEQGVPVTSAELAFQSPVQTAKPVALPTETPAATRTPDIVPVIITLFPTPTSAPSPTPTPTFEPLSDKPIMGFVFKSPQEVPNTRDPVGPFEIVEWLPNNSKEVLIKGPLSLETVNVLSGTSKLYATVKEPGNIRQPVWLPDTQGIAYLSRDFQTNKTNLLLGKVKNKPELLLSDVQPPLIPIQNRRGIAVYSKPDKVMKGVSLNKQLLSAVPAVLDRLPQSERSGFEAIPYTAVQPNGDWIAHYNIEGLQLVNSRTGEIKIINLGGNESEPLWAQDVKWSPDGQKMALIVTQGEFPIPFSDLFILDWPSGTLQKLGDTFAYITDVAWAPDSRHILLKPIIDEKDGFAITALYITDVSAVPSELVPVPIPIEGLTGSSGSLSWSPDGRTVLVEYFDGQETALYKIEVTPR